MGKISNKVSKGLGAAIAEAQAKINGNVVETENLSGENAVEELLNSGAEAQKKRKRRTKAEMEAARQAESQDNSLFETLIPEENDDRPEWEKRHAVDHEEFCEWELEKAKLKNLPEPDFDFRDYYAKGQIVYFVRVLEALGEKEVKKLYIRTVYPRMIIGSEEKSCCQCIGYNDRDRIFLIPRDADAYAKSLNITPKYESETPKSKRKNDFDTDEGVEDENNVNEAYTDSEEVQDE